MSAYEIALGMVLPVYIAALWGAVYGLVFERYGSFVVCSLIVVAVVVSDQFGLFVLPDTQGGE